MFGDIEIAENSERGLSCEIALEVFVKQFVKIHFFWSEKCPHVEDVESVTDGVGDRCPSLSMKVFVK